MQPLVSICIPTFNAEQHIGETIASALAQTYPAIEIIVSDDNSTDQTLKIVAELLSKSSIPFQIFSHSQYGLGKNWNYCIEQAKGKYIKFLFQDDLLRPHCVAEMVKIAEVDAEIGMVFAPRHILFTDETSIDPIYINITDRWSVLETIQSGKKLLADPHLLTPPFNKIGEPSNVLIRQAVFDLLGGFDPNLQQVIDLDMWLRIMGDYKIGFVNQILSDFRVHQSQLSQLNTATGIAWLDTWKLFLKILSDRVYDFLPNSVKVQIADYCSSQIAEVIGELYTLRTQNIHLDQQIQVLGDQNEILGKQVEYFGKQAELAYAQVEAAKQAFTKLTTAEIRLDHLGKELENLHQEYLQLGQILQATTDHLLVTNANLVETQSELATSNSTIAGQKGSIEYLENCLTQTIQEKIAVEQDRDTQIAILNENLREKICLLDQKDTLLNQKNTLLNELNCQLETQSIALGQAHDQITAMESSKFWKLRGKWLQIKKFLRLHPGEI